MANFIDILNALTNNQAPSGPNLLTGAASPPLPPTVAPMSMPADIIPPAPVDRNAIMQRFLGLAGPAPTPPPPQAPAGFLDKLAAALGGIQAGFQGRGQEYVKGIKEEKERPRKEFEAKQQRFEDRKLQLGLTGAETTGRAEELQQRRLTEQEDKLFEREVAREARRLGLQDQKEIEMFRDSLLAKRQREDDERAALAAQKVAEKQQRQQAAELAKAYRLAGAGEFSTELGERDAGLRAKVSVAADKWLSNKVKLDELRARRAAGGGGTPASGILVELDNGMGTIPLEQYQKIQGAVGAPKRFIMPGGDKTPPLTPESIKTTIANVQGKEDPKAIAIKLRSLAKTDAERAMVEQEIKAAGLEQPIAPPPRFLEPGATGAFGGKTLPEVIGESFARPYEPLGPKVGPAGRREPVK